jgi:hypothetical protein
MRSGSWTSSPRSAANADGLTRQRDLSGSCVAVCAGVVPVAWRFAEPGQVRSKGGNLVAHQALVSLWEPVPARTGR